MYYEAPAIASHKLLGHLISSPSICYETRCVDNVCVEVRSDCDVV